MDQEVFHQCENYPATCTNYNIRSIKKLDSLILLYIQTLIHFHLFRYIEIVSILDNGNKAKNMELVNSTFQITAHIQDSLLMVKQKEMADYFTLMVIFILETGKMIKLMVMENIFLEMVQFIRVNGKKIFVAERENKNG